MSDIVLKVGGQVHEGWESIEVVKSLDNMATTFGFLVSDRFPGEAQKWTIKLGQSCKVEINGHQIAQGFIEEMNPSYSGDSHTINISGRDVTGDLIDCCHWYSGYSNQWDNQSLTSIVKSLCDPFDIEVVIDSSVTTQANYKLVTFKSTEGDKVFELISKLCRSKAILPVSYGDGRLTLTRRGRTYAHDSLEMGKNILDGSASLSNLERYSDYIVKGSSLGGDDLIAGPTTTTDAPSGKATDEVIIRHRPLVILLEEADATIQKCKFRANWEARLRAGQSRSYNYSVQGWLQSNGEPWPLNSLVRVKDSLLGIEDSLLISQVSFNLAEGEGKVTRLTVVDPDTYELKEEPIKKKTKFDYDALIYRGK